MPTLLLSFNFLNTSGLIPVITSANSSEFPSILRSLEVNTGKSAALNKVKALSLANLSRTFFII